MSSESAAVTRLVQARQVGGVGASVNSNESRGEGYKANVCRVGRESWTLHHWSLYYTRQCFVCWLVKSGRVPRMRKIVRMRKMGQGSTQLQHGGVSAAVSEGSSAAPASLVGTLPATPLHLHTPCLSTLPLTWMCVCHRVEKYRPQNLDELISHRDIISTSRYNNTISYYNV